MAGSSEGAAGVFAALLSGSIAMIPNANPKGQNSSGVGQASEKKQSTDSSEPSVQNPNEQGSKLGYANLVLPFLIQPMLQRDLPAGKEANSGNAVSQRTENSTIASSSLNLLSPASDEVSAQSGMTTQKAKGDNPKITELDNYRQVIADLLGALSGKIADTSQQGTPLGLGNTGTKDLSQNMVKIVQGWMTLADGANNGQVATGQSSVNPELNAKSSTLLTALNLILSPASKDAKTPQEVSTQSSEPSAVTAVQNQNTELDNYGQVIADLLGTLSGEITDTSPQRTSLGSGIAGTKDFSQDMVKIVQGWMTLADADVNNGQALTGQKEIQSLINVITAGQSSVNPELNAKASALLAAFYPIVSLGEKDTKTSQGGQQTLQAEGDRIDPISKGHLETFTSTSQPKGMENALDSAVTSNKETVMLGDSRQKSVEVGFQENKTPKNVQGVYEEIHKGDPPQPSALKDVQNPNLSAGLGVASNNVVANVGEGKTSVVPVWEQISTTLREQVLNRSQDLKQLGIQLHPADLGEIQIDMHWENGQVHLQVQASEAATGQLLQNHLADLRQALSNQGVNCGMLQMGQGGDRQQNSHGDGSRRPFQQNVLLNEDEELSSVILPLSPEQDGKNQINVTA
ncbi:MAG: flagellar hook-length control protein FliK [Desulfosporosinus sp.]|nr:flagellar hook-length control protein FliK [Desulfosporosinus sp.]